MPDLSDWPCEAGRNGDPDGCCKDPDQCTFGGDDELCCLHWCATYFPECECQRGKNPIATWEDEGGAIVEDDPGD